MKKTTTLILAAVSLMAFATFAATPVLKRGQNGTKHINPVIETLYDLTVARYAVVVDTNAVPDLTAYTPAGIGQIVVGTASNTVSIATGATTNDWTTISN